EDADGGQGEHEREDVREVAKQQEQVDLHREGEAGPRAVPPPAADREEEEREADREVVEPELKELVVGEREGKECEPSLPRPHRAHEIPGAAEEEQHVAAHQQLLGDEGRHDEHEERHGAVADPVRIGTPVDLVVLLEKRILPGIAVLAENPGVVGVAGPVHGGQVVNGPEGKDVQQGQREEQPAEPDEVLGPGSWVLGLFRTQDPGPKLGGRRHQPLYLSPTRRYASRKGIPSSVTKRYASSVARSPGSRRMRSGWNRTSGRAAAMMARVSAARSMPRKSGALRSCRSRW